MDGDASVSTLEIDIEIPLDRLVGDGKRKDAAEQALSPAA